jgi:tetratricopeptide (TPR) repeat protein
MQILPVLRTFDWSHTLHIELFQNRIMITDECKTSDPSSATSTCADFQFSVPELMNLGHDAVDRRDYNLAAKYFQAALSTLKDQYKLTNAATDGVASASSCPSVIEYEIAVASSHLGRCCMALGLTKDALRHYQEELRFKRLYYNYTTDVNDDGSASSNEENVAECSHKELRNVNLDLALSIERVGKALILVGDYKTAKRHYHEALDMKRLVYGKEQQLLLQHPNDAQSLDSAVHAVPNISSIRSFESFKPTVYGYDLIQNTDIAYTNVQLGVICHYLRQFHKARNYYAAALSMYRTVFSEPNACNSASQSKFENRLHGDKRETFDIVEVKTLQPPTTKESQGDSDLTCNVNHIDIVKVMAQLGRVNAVMNKIDYANQYFNEAITMVQQLIADSNNSQEDVSLFTTTLETIQKEQKRNSEKRNPSTENHHPISWSNTIQ